MRRKEPPAFFNTTGEKGLTLDYYFEKAAAQQDQIHGWIKDHKAVTFTREDLEPILPSSTPITSIVRALCNLRARGIIEVVGKKTGRSGRPIFQYRYKPEAGP